MTNRVLEELERVCAAPELSSSPKLRQLLRYLVTETLAGRSEQLKAYTIAVDGMGRSEKFCPDTDPYIRNLAVRLRRALAGHYLKGDADSGVQILLGKGSYALEFRTRPAGGDPVVTRLPTGGAHTTPQRVPGAPRLRIYPLQEAQAGPAAAELGSALAEKLVVELRRFPNIRLYDSLDADDAGEADREGGAGQDASDRYALRGRIRAGQDEVCITMRLLDARTSECLWAQIYQWPAGSADAAEAERLFVRRVAVTLSDWDGVIPSLEALAGTSGVGDQALSPYLAAVKAHAWGAILSDAAFLDAVRELRICVEENPESAIAHAILSDLYFSDYLSGIGYVEGGLEQAEALARRAIVLDPASPEAHWALGQIGFARGDLELFESEFSQAMRLNPNDVTITASFGLFLSGLGQTERGLEHFEKATRLSGYAPPWAYMSPWLSHYQSGDYPAAVTAADCIQTPGLFWGALAHAATFGMTGDKPKARAAIDELTQIQPHFSADGRALLGHLIRSKPARELITEGLSRAGMNLDAVPVTESAT